MLCVQRGIENLILDATLNAITLQNTIEVIKYYFNWQLHLSERNYKNLVLVV